MYNFFTEHPILSHVLGITKEDAVCDCPTRYNSFALKAQGSKKIRMIEAPCPHLKQAQRALLNRILSHVEPHQTAMAFVHGRSIAMNARRHHGAFRLFKTDIRSFFPSITAAAVMSMLERHFVHLTQEVKKEIVDIVTLDGRLPQGAPTSPYLSNLVMFEFDERCHWFCNRLGAVYTRYADDVSISSSDSDILEKLEVIVRDGIHAMGMELHAKKTRHYDPSQRKTVTGLDIGNVSLRPPRAFRKKAAALVRMAIKYPNRMERHRCRIIGHLAFWYDVDPADRELEELLFRMGLTNWANRVSQEYEIPF
jgi:RNA-directed DNA polymerase